MFLLLPPSLPLHSGMGRRASKQKTLPFEKLVEKVQEGGSDMAEGGQGADQGVDPSAQSLSLLQEIRACFRALN